MTGAKNVYSTSDLRALQQQTKSFSNEFSKTKGEALVDKLSSQIDALARGHDPLHYTTYERSK
jgi:hypothetical protein